MLKPLSPTPGLSHGRRNEVTQDDGWGSLSLVVNMRQQRWLELINDYKLEVHYHPGKTNMVADALSHKH
jgi:hypothetical protein